MGDFNILYSKVQCANCNKVYNGCIQFKFGDTRQLKYNTGDIITWGGNDIGIPGIPKVKAYGILDFKPCPHCNQTEPEREFDIFIENDRIISVEPIANPYQYIEVNDGCYLVI